MKIYVVTNGNSQDGFKLSVYLFLASALASVNRLIDAKSWAQEKGASPWQRRQAGKNTVWQTASGQSVELIPVSLLFRDWSLKRWFWKRFSYQNLNEKGREDVKGSILRNGRAWFRPFTGHKRQSLSFNWEWVLWSKRVSVGLGLADYDHALSFHVCLYLFSFYFTVEHWRLEQWLQEKTKREGEKYGNGRTIGFTWMEGSLMIDLWNDPMEWRSRDPKWWHFSINLKQSLFGRRKYESKVIETHEANVTMPEGTYRAIVTIHQDSWTYHDWPFRLFPKVQTSARIEVPQGIPVPGKGENSYDCGEDAIYSTGSSSPTVSAAVSSIISSALKSRERYGGRNWRPEAARA